MRRGFWIAKGVRFLVIVAVVLGVVGFIVMSLWNWLVPALFGGPMLNYWQALGLLLLTRLLFGGLRPHGHGPGRGGPWGRRWHHMRERWEQMTPEERERFRNRVRGGWPCRGWDDHEDREGAKNGGNA